MTDTPYKQAIDVFTASDQYKKSSDPTTLGAVVNQRQFLENRLHSAFSAGWIAREDVDAET